MTEKQFIKQYPSHAGYHMDTYLYFYNEGSKKALNDSNDYSKGWKDAFEKALALIDDMFDNHLNVQDSDWYEEYRDEFIEQMGGEEKDDE